jgi:hypothetical protein
MRKTLTAALLVCFAASARAEEAKPSPWTFALHGFVSMSGYVQDAKTGLNEGQRALYATSPKLVTDENSLGFDVRQSRFNFSVKGPQVFMGATPSAVLEIDFMQGFGEGNFGNVSLMNRMRLAYSELNWGNNRLAFGQLNDLTFAQAPYSLSHIAFPLGYGTGNIGWRRPGFWGFHTLPIASDYKLEFAWEVGRSQWTDAATATGGQTYNSPNDASLGEASTLPAVQARLTLASKLFTIWAAGHWNRVDMNGVGTGGGTDDFDVTAGAAGLKIAAGPVTLAGAGFYGQNTGALLGNIVQFNPGGWNATTTATGTGTAAPPAAPVDVTAWGFWAQLGVNLTKELSVWGLYGAQEPDNADAKKAGFTRLKNETINAFLQYRDGGYALAGEWTNFKTKTATYAAGAFVSDTDLKANQYMLTATYFF